MKIGVIGHGRSGKDTVGEWFGGNTYLRYGNYPTTTSEVILQAISAAVHWSTPGALAPKMEEIIGAGYATMDLPAIFADRHQRRVLWYDLGCLLTAEDPAAMVRKVLDINDVATGMRRRDEFAIARPLFDVVLWVTRPGIPSDPTMFLGENDADLTIWNDGSVADLHAKLRRIFPHLAR